MPMLPTDMRDSPSFLPFGVSARLALAFIVVVGIVASGVTGGATPVDAGQPPELTERFRVSADQNAYYDLFTPESRSSVAFGDVTGNGQPNVVMGGMDGRLIVGTTDGQLIAQYFIGAAEIQGTPAIADIDGDGVLDIVIGNIAGDIVAMRGDGSEIFRNKTNRFADQGKSPAIYSSPVVGDIDNDGRPEIVLTSNDHSLNAWNHDGSVVPGFPVTTLDSSWSTPAIADIDGDGFAEIIGAFDIDYVTAPHAGCPSFGSAIRAYDHTGNQKWQTCIPGEIITASSAIGDIDADGDLDVVVGSGVYFSAIGEAEAPARRVYALDGPTGAMLPGWPADLGGVSDAAPTLGNLDDDPQLEIATSANDGRIHVLEHDGSLKWAKCAMWPGAANFSCDGGSRRFPGIVAPVSIADVDNDGQQEVVGFIHTHLWIMNGANGDPERVSSPIADYGYAPKGQPTVVSHNGEALILVQYLQESSSTLNGRNVGDDLTIVGFGTGAPLGPSDWPMFGANSSNTGSGETNWDGGRWMTPWLSGVYVDLLGRQADSSGLGYWTNRLSSDLSKGDLALQFAKTDEWLGVVVDDLYFSILGRGPDAGGRAFWISQLKSGRPTAEVVASFFSSPEYFQSVGGTNPLFVDALYQAILARSPDAQGKAFWVGRLNGGEPRGTLSSLVFTSYESGGRRVDSLYAKLLKRAPDAGGRDYWANYLTSGDEIVLAALLVGSDEYQILAESRFPTP